MIKQISCDLEVGAQDSVAGGKEKETRAQAGKKQNINCIILRIERSGVGRSVPCPGTGGGLQITRMFRNYASYSSPGKHVPYSVVSIRLTTRLYKAIK